MLRWERSTTCWRSGPAVPGEEVTAIEVRGEVLDPRWLSRSILPPAFPTTGAAGAGAIPPPSSSRAWCRSAPSVWFFLQPPDRREAGAPRRSPRGSAAGRSPRGSPSGSSSSSRASRSRHSTGLPRGSSPPARGIRSLALPLRVLLAPRSRALLWFVWFLFQLLFAVDAFLVVVSALVGLLLVVRIVSPGFLPDVLPDIPLGPGR